MEAAGCSAAALGNGDPAAPRERGMLPERLQRREQERQLEAERRKQSRQDLEVEEEKSSFLAAALAREREAVEALLRGEDAAGRLEEAAERLQGLRKLLNDSVRFLSNYNLRQGQEALAQLQAALAQRRQELQPGKRFAFRARRNQAAGAAGVDAAPAAEAPASASARVPKDENEATPETGWACGFSDLAGQILEKRAAELHQQDVLLSGLTDCTVRLWGNPNTLRLAQARGCRVLCGPVSTSVFLENCTDCVLAVACQQLRVHTTANTRIFLQVTSKAIVEDCSRIQFAPYTWSYPGIEQDFQSSGLDRSRNNWNDVADFNWLVRGVASPNWSILPEEEWKIPCD
ncbi:tubulin-specific chaperone C [Perognathus longimembris pacificus]|uniref:tubulin-specific chaperone C n=1 Tax=Perognathus longimembris pacificus TaxID=214514 RepID=UPI002018EB17|nr:tubulin-specific chaperone C [Perognathus longimembris pacificus]